MEEAEGEVDAGDLLDMLTGNIDEEEDEQEEQIEGVKEAEDNAA